MAPLLSDEHFSVDGTLVEAWASMKSFRPKTAATLTSRRRTIQGRAARRSPKAASPDKTTPSLTPSDGPTKDRNAELDFHGEKRSNETHVSSPIPTPGSTARVKAKRRSSATWATR